MENQDMENILFKNRNIDILVGILCVLYVVALFSFFDWQEKSVEKSADIYRACIEENYHQTPEQCRDANAGVYCACE